MKSPSSNSQRFTGHSTPVPQIVISPDDEDAQLSDPCDPPADTVLTDSSGSGVHEKKARYSFKKAALLVQGMLRFQKTVGQVPVKTGLARPGLATPRRASADTVMSSEISSTRSESETDDDSTWRSSYRSSYRSAREPSSINAGAERGTNSSQVDGGSSRDLPSWPRVHAPATAAPASTVSSWFQRGLVRPAAHLLVAKPGDGSDVKHIGQRWRRTRTKIIASVRLQKTDLHLLTPSFSSSSSQSPAGATSIANGSEQPGGPLSHWRKARNIVLAATRLKALKNIPEVEDSYPEDRSADNSHRPSEESQRHSVRSGAHGPYQGKETLVHEAQAAQMLALQAASDSAPASGPPTVGSEQGAATDKGEFVPPEASNPRMVTLPRHYAMASLL